MTIEERTPARSIHAKAFSEESIAVKHKYNARVGSWIEACIGKDGEDTVLLDLPVAEAERLRDALNREIKKCHEWHRTANR